MSIAMFFSAIFEKRLKAAPGRSGTPRTVTRASFFSNAAPHTAAAVCSDTWSHPYTRQVAAFPDRWTMADKFWPSVGRVDNVYGDRNLVCTCS